jgi:chromosome segregation ATPase
MRPSNRLTVLQNNQLTDELEYQSKQTEKLLTKNQKLEESVAVLKREVEIHKKVELELAQKSQKAQNEINSLSKQVKDAEKVKEELALEHKDSLKECQDEQNDDMNEQVFSLEKQLNLMHREITSLKKMKEKLSSDSSTIAAKLKILHESEHPCISMLQDFVVGLEKTQLEGRSSSSEQQDGQSLREL